LCFCREPGRLSKAMSKSSQRCHNAYLRGPDPLPPNCSTPPSVRSIARFALVLHGGVSLRNGKLTGSSPWLRNDDDVAASFVDVRVVHSHFVKFLMEPSGGSDSFHTFVHSSVTSNEVQQQLLRLYKPVATSFIGRYGSVWSQGFSREANENASAHVLSRWASASLALQLVRAAEDARGVPYEFIYLTRPDVVLWVGVDLRHYCKDAVYYSNCYPPFFPGRNKGCPSDFHYVMSSDSARRFAGLYPHHLRQSNPDNETNEIVTNARMRSYVQSVVGVAFRTDHVVIARHEEVLRKTPDLHMEADYRACVLARPTLSHPSPLARSLPLVHPSPLLDRPPHSPNRPYGIFETIRSPGRRLNSDAATVASNRSISSAGDGVKARPCWIRLPRQNLHAMINREHTGCSIRFAGLAEAQRACERTAHCGGVSRDRGLTCGGRVLRFELRSAQPKDLHAAATTSWLLQGDAAAAPTACASRGHGLHGTSGSPAAEFEPAARVPAADDDMRELPPRIALVVRGKIYEAAHRPLSTAGSFLKPYTHSFLRAWPSMRDRLLDAARRGCNGSTVDIFVTAHASARERLPPGYLRRLLGITANVLFFGSIPDRQFAVAAAFLEHFAPRAYMYSIVIMTRDDFVYDADAWATISARYDPHAINLVSNDCANASWDGLHVFAPAAVTTLAHTLRGKGPAAAYSAHGITRGLAARGVRWRIHYWYTGMYGAPDFCRPAMGYVDRGSNVNTFEHRVFLEKCEAGRRKVREQNGVRTAAMRPCEQCCAQDRTPASSHQLLGATAPICPRLH